MIHFSLILQKEKEIRQRSLKIPLKSLWIVWNWFAFDMDPLKTEKFQSLIPKMIESGCKSWEILRECGIRKKTVKILGKCWKISSKGRWNLSEILRKILVKILIKILQRFLQNPFRMIEVGFKMPPKCLKRSLKDPSKIRQKSLERSLKNSFKNWFWKCPQNPSKDPTKIPHRSFKDPFKILQKIPQQSAQNLPTLSK